MSAAQDRKRLPSFWPLQLGGWLLYGLVMGAASIPFRRMREYVGFQNCLIVSEFLGSFLVWWVCRALWRRRMPLLLALGVSVAACIPIGFAASALAMLGSVHLLGTSPNFLWPSVLASTGGSTFVLIAWSGFYLGLKHYSALEQQKGALLRVEGLAREAQIRALRYQLQPHFLFNTLNAISTLVLNGEVQTATRMIARLGDLLRRSLDSPNLHMTSLRDEIDATREYIDIEQVRFGDKLRVSTRVGPDLGEASIPRFLLQPLVENAIRHGIARRRGGGSILIRATQEASQLVITIQNEVAEVVSDSLADGNSGLGLGLENTRMRLEEVYGSQSSFIAGPTGEGAFQVCIAIPHQVSERHNSGS